MATRKCRNIYFRKYFMARKFTNIFVLMLILMVGSHSIHCSSFASHKKATDRPTVVVAPTCQPSEDEPPDHETGKKKFFISGIRGDLFGHQCAT